MYICTVYLDVELKVYKSQRICRRRRIATVWPSEGGDSWQQLEAVTAALCRLQQPYLNAEFPSPTRVSVHRQNCTFCLHTHDLSTSIDKRQN